MGLRFFFFFQIALIRDLYEKQAPSHRNAGVFASCLWIYEAFGNTPYIISCNVFLYTAMMFAYSGTMTRHKGIKQKILKGIENVYFKS